MYVCIVWYMDGTWYTKLLRYAAWINRHSHNSQLGHPGGNTVRQAGASHATHGEKETEKDGRFCSYNRVLAVPTGGGLNRN